MPSSRVQGTRIASPLSPPHVRDRQHLLGDAFDDRDELDERGFQLIAEKSIHLQRVVCVGGMDAAQDVDVDAVPVLIRAAHHIVECSGAAFVDAIVIVEFARAIQAQSDQEFVPLKKAHHSSLSFVPLV